MDKGFIIELEQFDLGDLGFFDCRFYGSKDYCLESRAYTRVSLFQIAIPGLGDSGASLLVHASRLEKGYLEKLEDILMGELNEVN